MRMRRVILPSVAVPYFATLSNKQHEFRKKEIFERKMHVVFSLQRCRQDFSF